MWLALDRGITVHYKHTQAHKNACVVQAESLPHSTGILTGWGNFIAISYQVTPVNNLRRSWPQRAERDLRPQRILSGGLESTCAPGVTGKVNWGELMMFPAGTGDYRAQGQSENYSAYLRTEQQCLILRDQSLFFLFIQCELSGCLPPIYCCSGMMKIVFIEILFMFMWFFSFLSNNVRQFGPVKNKVKNKKTATSCGLYFCNERKFLLLTMSNLIVLTWPYLKQACPAPTSNKCG